MPRHRRISFHTVRDEVKRRIEDRIWPQGTLLPTETELAQEFECARATVNRALRELADQGFIERRRRSGTRVMRAPVKQARIEIAVVRHVIEEQNAEYRYALVDRQTGPAPAWLCSQLGLDRAAPVLHVLCMHYADNRPFQFEERWINLAAVPEIEKADLTCAGPNEWLLDAVPFTEAEISFAAVAADARLAEFLATPTGTPVMQMERTTWLPENPVTLARMTHHPGFRLRTRY
ncbi:transcriptional regulator, GntR family [Cribrihabitans marinus]|uniref:Transcriptional regulator, GntR family n=1 Tax=Cribrihabitans marinus TaxID=1227549 RepID=A0A1H7A634_9RHOB|nr:GntR family transcriptional regulator [Cribrihabitans marinus]GGH30057.1 GntR family transcriptional regulator [Cribrihabitans marinus]SEJ56515.1 transcriptional regulator, GntR family [Cribrihabitans marinus]